MAAPVLLRNARDTFVAQSKPNASRPLTPKLWLASAGAGNERFAYIFFGKPYPPGATIVSAKLRVWNGNTWPGTVTLTAHRISEKWAASRVTYNTRPSSLDNAGYSVTKTGAAPLTMWEIDIAPMLQLVSNGGYWYGIRLSVNTTTDKWIYSTDGSADYRPQLEITWSDAPLPPEELSPDGGRAVSVAKPTLTFDFTDVSGDTDLNAVQVKTNSVDDYATATWDSGEVGADAPELDLSKTTFPGITAGSSIFWWVRVKDGAGKWSAWSDSAHFTMAAKGTLVLNNPPDIANSYVEDTTPPILWSFTGAVQRAYQIILTKPDDPHSWIWTSGKITSTAQAHDIPAGYIKNLNRNYRLVLRVWDDANREKTPGDPVWVQVERDFKHQVDPTVDPVTNLAVTQSFPWPWVDVTWSRATAADEYTIIRDDEVVDTVLASEATTGGTNYSFRDRRVSPRVNHVWKVIAVVNRKGSGNNPTVTAMTKPNATWLMKPDSSLPIVLLKSGSEPGPVVEASQASFQEMHHPVARSAPVLISQNVGGYEGHVDATLADGIIPGLTAREMRDRFKTFKRHKGQTLLLYMVDETLEIVAYNMTYRPRAKSGGTILYDVSFDFFEAE